MSDRFKGLITENQFQRKRRNKNQFSSRNKNTGNGINIARRKLVKPDFKLNTNEFPTLENKGNENHTKTNVDIKSKTNFIDITNKYEHKNSDESPDTNNKNATKEGWTAMKFNRSGRVIFNDKRTIPSNDNEKRLDKYREKYNRSISKYILEERFRYRDELNEILGDMSPYWNQNY